MSLSVNVAVIGAGLSGLAVARELQREGHTITIYEKSSRLGGTWVYNPRTESDPLSVDPTRQIIHSSLYSSLRTNLPRQVMCFSDYPFFVREGGDERNFPVHKEVLMFLESFAGEFGLVDFIRFDEEVVKVKQFGEGEWVVESRKGGGLFKEVFEAVVVCSGNQTEARLPELPGAEIWPGKQIHSHNYRNPDTFEGQVVVIVGSGPSAKDISVEVATVAKEVHLSSRSPNVKVSKLVGHTNIWQHSKVKCLRGDGEILFEDGCSVYADTLMHCTGYKYNFPFLETNGIVSVDDNRVGPLYKHIFPPQLAPTLSFVGLPLKGIGVQSVELQSKWIASVLSGRVKLPSKEEMLEDTEQHYKKMKDMEIPKHYTHSLYPLQMDYVDWLASQVGSPPPDKAKRIFAGLIEAFVQNQNYRD